MNYSAGVIRKDGSVAGKAFESKEEAETYIMDFAEQGIKQGRIRNLKTGEEEVMHF